MKDLKVISTKPATSQTRHKPMTKGREDTNKESQGVPDKEGETRLMDWTIWLLIKVHHKR